MAGVLGVAFFLFLTAGAILSYWALRGEEIREAGWFVPAGLVSAALGELIAFALALRVAGAAAPSFMAAPSLLAAFALMLLMTFAYSAFLAHCSMKGIFRLRAIFMSDDAVAVRKRWWAAESAKHRKDLQKAAEIYKEESEENPKDTETRRRLAEVLVEIGRFDDALRELEQGIRLCEGDDNRSSLMFRMSDIIERHVGDRERSVRVLKELISRYPKSYYAKFARERLERIS